jgi:hypothetical protein
MVSKTRVFKVFLEPTFKKASERLSRRFDAEQECKIKWATVNALAQPVEHAATQFQLTGH